MKVLSAVIGTGTSRSSSSTPIRAFWMYEYSAPSGRQSKAFVSSMIEDLRGGGGIGQG